MIAIRAFFAVNVDVEALRRITSVQRRLRPRCAEAGWDIKWLAPPNVHLVLRYLGELCPVLPGPMAEALGPRIEPLPPLPVPLGGLRLVPPEAEAPADVVPHHLIVVDIAEAAHPRVAALDQALAEGLEDLGFRRPLRPAPPRLVIGRVRAAPEGSSFDALAALLAEVRDLAEVRSGARELVLYRSDAHSPKGEYQRLLRLPLSGEPVELEPPPPAEAEAPEASDEPPPAEEAPTPVEAVEAAPAEVEAAEEPPREEIRPAEAEAPDAPEAQEDAP